MRPDNITSKHVNLLFEDETDSTGSGGNSSGGNSSGVNFRDFTKSTTETRDDLLPAHALKTLISNHQDLNEQKVKEQKLQREKYKDLKNGKMSLEQYRQTQGLGAQGGYNKFKPNPILANSAQFSGIDRQVNSLPNENNAETNKDKQNELTYQHQLRLENRLINTPTFNPRPAGF